MSIMERRSHGSAASAASIMESGNADQLLMVAQSTLTTATATPDDSQSKRFKDLIRNKNELGSDLDDFKERELKRRRETSLV